MLHQSIRAQETLKISVIKLCTCWDVLVAIESMHTSCCINLSSQVDF